jgi:membrane protease YdiL (CAAX protease family)
MIISSAVRQHPIVSFYLLAFAISWSGYLPQTAYSYGLIPFQSPFFFIIGGLGPALAAVIIAFSVNGTAGVKGLFAGFLRWRAGLLWYGLALFGNALVFLAAAYSPGSGGLDFGKVGPLYLLIPLLLASFFMNMWEELGWRGFALPEFQCSHTAFVSAVAVGVLWGLWHLPLLFMKGYPMASYPLIPWFIGIVASSVIYAWLYNNTSGSLLIVTLFHVGNNAAGSYLTGGINDMGSFMVAQSMVLCIAAAVVTLAFGYKRLSRSVSTQGPPQKHGPYNP